VIAARGSGDILRLSVMSDTRRRFLQVLAGGTVSVRLSSAKPAFKLGVTDWNLRQAGKVEAVGMASKLGFQGVEVSLGRTPADNRLPLDDSGIQQQYLAAAREHRIALAGTCLDILHVNYLKSDKLGQKWVADGIPITKRLNAKVMLMPFFGKGALANHAEMDYVGDILRELAPEAQKAGVLLGLEDTISAADNVRIMERSQSPAVKVYYDVGNSTNQGFQVAEEIRWLGSKRICQVHLKDKGYLGEGAIDFPAVIRALEEIGYRDFANLETSSPSKSIESDMARNLAFLRKLMG
jgi:L-ribulose-5-phosphate 3-epimerase